MLSFIICCFAVNLASTQVVINEFSAANQDQFFDNYFDDEDWFELYNAGATAVDLSGYYLSDKIDNPTKFEIPAGVTIAAGGFLRVWASDRNEFVGGVLHTNFKITQTRNNEAIIFSSPSGTIIDFNPIDVPNKVNESWARTTDGGSTWGVDSSPTPNGSNTSVDEAYAERPQIQPSAGVYTGSVEISIEINDPSLTVRYTTNGMIQISFLQNTQDHLPSIIPQL